jgi:hypothetical protein
LELEGQRAAFCARSEHVVNFRIPFLKTRTPEFVAMPAAARAEFLARCNDDPSMKALARWHMNLMRIGWGFLGAAVGAYFVFGGAQAGFGFAGVVLASTIVIAILWVPLSIVLYHRRATRQLRRLLQQSAEACGEGEAHV